MEYSYSVGYKDVTFSSLNTVRLVAFNTALLSFMPGISEDKMWIGQRQVKTLMHYGIIPNDEVHYTISLFHHAERFLHPNEICEYNGRVSTLNLLKKNVDLILCGHTETGGRPVLYQQIGGGKVLTAGTTYYSDTHPNAFSILCICGTKKDICVTPYKYKNEWRNYELEKQPEAMDGIVKLPAIGDLNEECRFILKSDDKIYEIPLKKVSVYRFEKAGVPYIKLDNRKEVLRHLDIVCEGPASGKKTNVTVSLAHKMKRNIRDILDREEYFSFIAKNIINNHRTKFYIESKSGVKLISGSGLKGSADVDEESTELLRKIGIIEKYYDVILCRPDELYERDLEHIELLNDLIENDYTDKLSLGSTVSTDIIDFEELKKFYEQSKKNNSFCLVYEGVFYCKIFGVRFSLGEVLIVAGKYSIDGTDLKYKVDTFREGDSRRIIFTANDIFNTFFVVDREKAKEKAIIESECEIFSVDKIGLSWGFIDEEK